MQRHHNTHTYHKEALTAEHHRTEEQFLPYSVARKPLLLSITKARTAKFSPLKLTVTRRPLLLLLLLFFFFFFHVEEFISKTPMGVHEPKHHRRGERLSSPPTQS